MGLDENSAASEPSTPIWGLQNWFFDWERILILVFVISDFVQVWVYGAGSAS